MIIGGEGLGLGVERGNGRLRLFDGPLELLQLLFGALVLLFLRFGLLLRSAARAVWRRDSCRWA